MNYLEMLEAEKRKNIRNEYPEALAAIIGAATEQAKPIIGKHFQKTPGTVGDWAGREKWAADRWNSQVLPEILAILWFTDIADVAELGRWMGEAFRAFYTPKASVNAAVSAFASARNDSQPIPF